MKVKKNKSKNKSEKKRKYIIIVAEKDNYAVKLISIGREGQ